MPRFTSSDELIDFAIAREEEAFAFYAGMAELVKSDSVRDMFGDFAHEELGHKAKLLAMKRDGRLVRSEHRILNLKIADALVPVKPSPEMGYPDALRLAMQREKDAFRLYTGLADTVRDDAAREVFLMLAQEEAKHKLRFEIEYDDAVMTDN